MFRYSWTSSLKYLYTKDYRNDGTLLFYTFNTCLQVIQLKSHFTVMFGIVACGHEKIKLYCILHGFPSVMISFETSKDLADTVLSKWPNESTENDKLVEPPPSTKIKLRPSTPTASLEHHHQGHQQENRVGKSDSGNHLVPISERETRSSRSSRSSRSAYTLNR